MLPKVARTAILDYLVTDSGLNATQRLCKNNPSPSDEDVALADLTEADFAGYVPKTSVAFPSAIINGADHGETLSPTLTWTAGSLVGPQVIYAWFMTVTIGGSDKLMFFKRFSTPTTLMNPGDLVEKKIDLLSDDGNVPPF